MRLLSTSVQIPLELYPHESSILFLVRMLGNMLLQRYPLPIINHSFSVSFAMKCFWMWKSIFSFVILLRIDGSPIFNFLSIPSFKLLYKIYDLHFEYQVLFFLYVQSVDLCIYLNIIQTHKHPSNLITRSLISILLVIFFNFTVQFIFEIFTIFQFPFSKAKKNFLKMFSFLYPLIFYIFFTNYSQFLRIIPTFGILERGWRMEFC